MVGGNEEAASGVDHTTNRGLIDLAHHLAELAFGDDLPQEVESNGRRWLVTRSALQPLGDAAVDPASRLGRRIEALRNRLAEARGAFALRVEQGEEDQDGTLLRAVVRACVTLRISVDAGDASPGETPQTDAAAIADSLRELADRIERGANDRDAAPTVQTAERRRRDAFASVRNEDFDRPLFAAQ